MSVLFESDVHHIPVQSSDGKRLELAIQGNNKQFDSLDEIVDYFNLNPIQAATFQKIIRLNSHISINEWQSLILVLFSYINEGLKI